MGFPTEQRDHRSPHVYAETPCSATLEARRPEAWKEAPATKRERPKRRPATEDFSEFTNRSAIIQSSHPDANGLAAAPATDELWSPVLYDPNSDSVRIIPPSHRTPLGSQFRDFKEKLNEKTHRLAGLLSPDRSESLSLPLRIHGIGHKTTVSTSQISHPVQSSSSRLGRADWKEFE